MFHRLSGAARKSMRVVLSFVAFMFLFSGLVSAGNDQIGNLRISTLPDTKDALRILVQDATQDALHDKVFTYVPYLDSENAVEGLSRGEVDLVLTTMLPVARRILYEADHDVPKQDQMIVLAAAYQSPEVLTLVIDSTRGLSTPADLVGKSIGYIASGNREMVLDLELQALGISDDQVNILPIEQDCFDISIVAGELDAALVHPGFADRLDAAYPGRFLRPNKDVVHYETGVLVTTWGSLARNRNQILHFLQHAMEAEQRIVHAPADANRTLAAALDTPIMDIRREMKRHSFNLAMSEGTVGALGRMVVWECAHEAHEDCSDTVRDRFQPEPLSALKPGAVWMIGF